MQKNKADHGAARPSPAQERGVLYGVGVGPGAPDLLTLRAVGILQSVQVILAAASPKNDDSLALSIAAPHLPEGCETIRLDFPMTRDRRILNDAWRRNAAITAEILLAGKSAAFLTLGDPLIYSTFGYLMRTLEDMLPGLRVEIVPGITSYQEAAAKTRTVLCEGEENLLLLSGIANGDSLERRLSDCDSAVILKTYRNAESIRKAARLAGREKDCVFASRLGLEGENCGRGLDSMPDKPHYLSLLLLPSPGRTPKDHAGAARAERVTAKDSEEK